MNTLTATAKQTGKTGYIPPVERRPRRVRTVLETLALLAVGLVAIELFLNCCGVGMEEILQPDTTFGTRHIAGKSVVWRMEGFSNDKFSSAGLRDNEHSTVKAPAVVRIALLGDSATEGLQVPLQGTYGRQLEQGLNEKNPGSVEVINFACSGYSTGQEVLQFEQQVAAYKPDLTILLYNRGDNLENVRKPSDLRVEPRPYFYIDGQGSLTQDNAVLTAQAKALKSDRLTEFLRRESRIFGVFSHANLNLSINEPLYRKLKSWLTMPFSGGSKSKMVAQYPPQDGWLVTEKLIERLNQDCRNNGSKLLVVAFPNVNVDPQFGAQIADLERAAGQNHFAFFDLTQCFRWNKDPMSLFLKFHFSTKGHRLVAGQIAETIARQKLITIESSRP